MDDFKFFLKEFYPCCIIRSRYNGAYEDALWVAFAEPYDSNNLTKVCGGDGGCENFFATYDKPIGRGSTPEEAFKDLVKQCQEIESKKENL